MEEVVEGAFRFIARAIGHIFIEIILELLIKGPGYLIAKLISKNRQMEPTENKSIILGILFWCFIGGVAYMVVKYAI